MTRPPVCASENKLPIYGPVWLQFAKKYGMLFDGEWPKCTICAADPAQIFHTLSRKRPGGDSFFLRANKSPAQLRPVFGWQAGICPQNSREKTEENRKGVLCL
jgi:hypothetical protein